MVTEFSSGSQPPPFLGVHRTVVKKKTSPGTNFIRRDCHPSKKEGNFSAKAQRKLTGLYSIISLCPIKDGVLRPILKRRHLNAYIKVLWFKMLTTAQILETIEPNDWFTTIDCVFSCTPSFRPQKVPSFCLSKPGISVRGPPLWSLSLTSCLHQPTHGGYEDPSISRRLADLCTKPSSGLGGHREGYKSYKGTCFCMNHEKSNVELSQ